MGLQGILFYFVAALFYFILFYLCGRLYSSFLSVLSRFILTQNVCFPTHNNHILDLVRTSDSFLATSFATYSAVKSTYSLLYLNYL